MRTHVLDHLSDDILRRALGAVVAHECSTLAEVQFPTILPAVATGQLHLTGLGLLVPHLTPGNVDELLAAAVHRTKADIEHLLARRSPRTECLGLVQPIPAPAPSRSGQLAPAQVGPVWMTTVEDSSASAPGHPPSPRP